MMPFSPCTHKVVRSHHPCQYSRKMYYPSVTCFLLLEHLFGLCFPVCRIGRSLLLFAAIFDLFCTFELYLHLQSECVFLEAVSLGQFRRFIIPLLAKVLSGSQEGVVCATSVTRLLSRFLQNLQLSAYYTFHRRTDAVYFRKYRCSRMIYQHTTFNIWT